MNDVVIGIDLGTTNTCAAYYSNGKRGPQLSVLENDEGERITPSFLFFVGQKEAIVGNYARSLADQNPEFAIFAIKRIIGRKFDDPKVQQSLKYFPFDIEKTELNDPLIVIKRKDGTVKKSPEDLCAIILQKIKRDVEKKLGQKIDKTVITVPTYFNMNQRKATLDAANRAGFAVLKLLNEPTAAALKYYYDNECEDNSYSMVYDLGGGTFDVSILKKCGKNIDIIGVGGDSHLGGYDFDTLIVDHVHNLLWTKYKINALSDKKATRRLYKKCEEVKKMLTYNDTTKIVLEAFHVEHKIITFDLTRVQFENMAHNVIIYLRPQ